jgi:hypothetical protein
VVVRRQTGASKTAKEVDRLLASTPMDDDSAWVKKLAVSPDDAKGILEAQKARAAYSAAPTKVLPVEVWMKVLPDVKSTEKAQPNLLTAISTDLGASYAKVVDKKKELAKLKGDLTVEENAADAAKADADKKQHKDAAAKIEEQIKKAEDEVDPLVKKFLADAKDNAAKSKAEVRDEVGQALVNLREAVEDAKTANTAAILRYPMAAPGISKDVQVVVSDIVGDIVEEQTGKRPSLSGFKPDVALDGTKVSLKLNGLSQDDLGKIDMGKLLSETVTRTTSWVGDTLGLLGYASSTADLLGFESDTLDAVKAGFESAGWKAPAAVAIPEVVSAPAGAKK